jgi:hypothetical protein
VKLVIGKKNPVRMVTSVVPRKTAVANGARFEAISCSMTHRPTAIPTKLIAT